MGQVSVILTLDVRLVAYLAAKAGLHDTGTLDRLVETILWDAVQVPDGMEQATARWGRYVRCPDCGRAVQQTRHGVLRRHRTAVPGGAMCDGAGWARTVSLPPVTVAELATQRATERAAVFQARKGVADA